MWQDAVWDFAEHLVVEYGTVNDPALGKLAIPYPEKEPLVFLDDSGFAMRNVDCPPL